MTNTKIVDQEFLDLNPGLELEIGDEFTYPDEDSEEEIDSVLGDEGDVSDEEVLADEEEVVDETVTQDLSDIEEIDEVTPKVLIYKEKQVVREGIRVVGDREIKTLTLSDGSIEDISDEDYQELISK